MKRPKQTDKECRRQGMRDVPVANYSKMQDKYIDHLESKSFPDGDDIWCKASEMSRDNFADWYDSLYEMFKG